MSIKSLISIMMLFCCACTNNHFTEIANPEIAFADTISTNKVQTFVPQSQVDNSIKNAMSFNALQKKVSMANSVETVIKVIHIGDSHIKSGYFSEPFMQKLNDYYAQRYQNKLFFNFQWFCKSGTKYSDYNNMAELDVQLRSSELDVAIISLGTNDAFSGSSKVDFYGKIDHLVKKIKQLAPNAVILITTPPDASKYNASTRSYVALPALIEVVHTLRKYCVENSIAYWDLYQIMGGNYSINNYVFKKLAAPDHVHFTANGYGTFAQMLCEAFTKTIN